MLNIVKVGVFSVLEYDFNNNQLIKELSYILGQIDYVNGDNKIQFSKIHLSTINKTKFILLKDNIMFLTKIQVMKDHILAQYESTTYRLIE